MGMSEIWLPPAAVQLQEQGPEWLGVVDDQPWSDQNGFHRGFSSSFRVRPERDVWFHFPFPTPAGVRLEGVSLLWETLEEAAIVWVCLHHGGMERMTLSERGEPLVGMPERFDPPEQWRQYYPPNDRQRTDLAVAPAVETRFGVQLCVLVRGPGVVRFYGAGARFAD